jgi:hypothetical protein
MLAALLISLANRKPVPPPPAALRPAVTTPVIRAPEAPGNSLPTATRRPPEAGLKQWTVTLRAAGVPEKVIADVTAADFDARWQKRQVELQRQIERGEADPEALTEMSLRYSDEQEKELRGALGDEGYRHWDQARILSEYELADLKLSAEESDTLYQLRKSFEQKQREWDRARNKGDLDEAEFQKLVETQQNDYNKQLKTLLGDDRYATSQNPIDPERMNLRRALKNLNVGETEAAGLLQAQQQWTRQRAKLEQQLQEGQLASADYEQQLKALDHTRDQEYQRVLGDNGITELQKAQDPRYQTMKRYASNWGLTDNDINHLYDTIRFYESSVSDYQQRAQALEEQGQPVDWPAVQKSIQEFSRQTESTLRGSLGERFDKLKKNNVLNLGE